MIFDLTDFRTAASASKVLISYTIVVTRCIPLPSPTSLLWRSKARSEMLCLPFHEPSFLTPCKLRTRFPCRQYPLILGGLGYSYEDSLLVWFLNLYWRRNLRNVHGDNFMCCGWETHCCRQVIWKYWISSFGINTLIRRYFRWFNFKGDIHPRSLGIFIDVFRRVHVRFFINWTPYPYLNKWWWKETNIHKLN